MKSLVAVLMLAGMTLATGTAYAGSIDDLAKTAATKPPVIWYESSPPEKMQEVIDTFNRKYPDIKVQYVRNTGGGGLAAKIIQESLANVPTASFTTADVQQLNALKERGLLENPDFKSLGIPDNLVGSEQAVAVAASLGVLIWNKNQVPDADVPKNWDELVDPKWGNHAGTWVRGTMYVSLAAAIGEDKARELVKKIVDQGAMGFQANAQVAQQTASGELDLVYGLYHTTQPILDSGAPVGLAFLEPVPTTTIWGLVIKSTGGNVEGAEVLLNWLTTPEGAKAYEAATLRGNPKIEGTRHFDLVKGKKLAEYPITELPTVMRLDGEFTQVLSKALKP